jgi:hypothetical protein
VAVEAEHVWSVGRGELALGCREPVRLLHLVVRANPALEGSASP